MLKSKLSLFFLLLSITAEAQTFTLKGDTHSHDYDGLTIYMFECGVGDRDLTRCIDSTRIVDGKYTIVRKAAKAPFMVRLALPMKDRYFSYGLLDANCIVEVGTILIDYGRYNFTLYGGRMNEEYDRKILKPNRDVRQRIEEYSDSMSRCGKETDNEYIRKQYDALNPLTSQYIADNINNAVGAYFFLGRPKEFFPEGMYDKLYQQVAADYRKNYEQRLQRENAEREYQLQARQLSGNGQPYRDFSSKTVDGKEVRFSDYVKPGCVTLLDFWASWCGPCRAEAPEIIRMYEQYHDKGFNIVSLSVDNNLKAWLKAVDELQFTWPQLCSGKAWKDEAVRNYAVQAIPFTIVIDKQGRLSEKNVHGEKLEELIKKLLEE